MGQAFCHSKRPEARITDEVYFIHHYPSYVCVMMMMIVIGGWEVLRLGCGRDRTVPFGPPLGLALTRPRGKIGTHARVPREPPDFHARERSRLTSPKLEPEAFCFKLHNFWAPGRQMKTDSCRIKTPYFYKEVSFWQEGGRQIYLLLGLSKWHLEKYFSNRCLYVKAYSLP